MNPQNRLRHHVTGAIERGEKEAIIEQPSLTRHTPGPWHVEKYQVPLGAGHYQIVGNNTHEIAYIPLRSGDAALIAAAPEMLEALKLCVTTTDDIAKGTVTDLGMRLCYINATIKQAITKAEGRG